MKKILFVALAMALPYIDYGQIIQNGDFYYNQGNDIMVGSNATFSTPNSNFPNWYRTHGTPRFYPLCDPNSPNAILLIDDYTGGGQGIAGGYQFYKNKQYYVWLLLCNPPQSFAGVVNIKATQNLPSGNLSPVTGLAPIPTNAGSTETIATLTTTSTPAFGYLVPLLFTPQNNNYNYIWLYPQANTGPGDQITVTALYVARACVEDLYLSQNAGTGYIQPDPDEGFYYRAYSNIHAGSSLGSGSVPVNVNGAAKTVFEAKRMVELLPDFTAAPGVLGSFEAHIDPQTCGTAGGYTDLPIPTQSGQNIVETLGRKIMETETEDNTVMVSDKFSLYPNPTTSKVTIETPLSGDPSSTQVTVSNVLGQVLYKTQTEQNKMDVDLSSYASGIYVITVKSGNGIKTFKVDKK